MLNVQPPPLNKTRCIYWSKELPPKWQSHNGSGWYFRMINVLEWRWWWLMFYGHFCAHGRLNGRSQRWNTLQIWPHRDSNTRGSDVWSNTLPLEQGGTHPFWNGEEIWCHKTNQTRERTNPSMGRRGGVGTGKPSIINYLDIVYFVLVTAWYHSVTAKPPTPTPRIHWVMWPSHIHWRSGGAVPLEDPFQPHIWIYPEIGFLCFQPKRKEQKNGRMLFGLCLDRDWSVLDRDWSVLDLANFISLSSQAGY